MGEFTGIDRRLMYNLIKHGNDWLKYHHYAVNN
jgi:hypothetical protein